MKNIKMKAIYILIAAIGLGTGLFFLFKESYALPPAVITCTYPTYTGSELLIAGCSGGDVKDHKKTNAGKYTVKCIGDKTHANADNKECKILPASVSSASIVNVSSRTYHGGVQIQNPTVRVGGRVLVNGTDYTITYKNNVNPGTATMTINGKGNYTGSKSTYFTIKKLSDSITITATTATYNGSGKTATAKAKSGNKVTLTYYSDSACKTKTTTSNATAAGGSPKTAGTYYAIGKTSATTLYAAETSACKKAVVINKADDKVTITTKTASYTGKGIATSAKAASGSKVTITYYSDAKCATKTTTSNATAAGGTPKAVGTYYAIGKTSASTNYKAATSSCTKAVVINKLNDKITITAKTSDYTGKGIAATAKSTSGSSVTLTYYSDAKCATKTTNSNATAAGGTPKNVGTYYAIGKTSASTNYNAATSSCTKAVVINSSNSGTDVTPTKEAAIITCQDKVYTGKEQEIATCSGGTISNNKQTNANSYIVKCTGDNNHTDAEKTCTIAKAEDDITVTLVEKEYTGSEVLANVKTMSNSSLTINYYSDATCNSIVSSPKEAGTYYIIAKTNGNSNYKEKSLGCTKAVVINAKNEPENPIVDPTPTDPVPADPTPVTQNKVPAEIECEDDTIYNGKEQIIATCEGGTIKNNRQTKIGEYTVTCIGDSNHTDAQPAICSISEIDIEDTKVTGISDKEYTGSAIKQVPTIKDGDITLRNDVDYTYTVTNNINVGTAKLKVTGKGNYIGEKEIEFNITKPKAEITCKDVFYNGEEQEIATCNGGTIHDPYKKDIDEYIITCQGDSNHDDALNKTCSIKKGNDTINVNYKEADYTGHEIEADIKVQSKLPMQVNYYSDSACTKAVTLPKAEGTYYVIVKTEGNDNYNAAKSSCKKAIKIVKKTIIGEGLADGVSLGAEKLADEIDEIINVKPNDEITITEKTATYTGKGIAASAKAISGNKVTLTYYSDSTCKTKTTTTNATKVGGTPKMVGIYYVKGTTETTDKYVGGKKECTKAVVINKANDTITIKEAKKSYSGSVVKSSATAESGSSVTLTYYTDETCKTKTSTKNSGATTAGGAPIYAGTYYAIGKTSASTNYKAAASACKQAIIISKKADKITLTSKTETYSGSEIKATAKATSGSSVTLTYYSDSSCKTKTTTKNAKTAGGAPVVAGTYYATGKTSASTNYSAANLSCTKAVVIDKAPDADKIHFIQTCARSGDAILLESNGHYAMIDTGCSSKTMNKDTKKEYKVDWKKMTYEYLQKIGVKKLDFILITHNHPDHRGALNHLLSKYKSNVGKLYIKTYNAEGLSRSETFKNIISKTKEVAVPVSYIDKDFKDGGKITLGDMTIKLYNTGYLKKNAENDNSNSVLELVSVNGYKALLTGDFYEYDENVKYMNTLSKKDEFKNLDILKMPHHGYSSCAFSTKSAGLASKSSESAKNLNPTYIVYTSNGEEGSTQCGQSAYKYTDKNGKTQWNTSYNIFKKWRENGKAYFVNKLGYTLDSAGHEVATKAYVVNLAKGKLNISVSK